MRLKYLKDEVLYEIKHSISINSSYYSNKDSQWLLQLLDNTDIANDGAKDYPKFKLLNRAKSVLNDFENSKIIYANMINLSDIQATDERIWTFLTHVDCWEYMQSRWPVENGSRISERYLVSSGKRGLLRNGISRLWWGARLTYLPFDEDPFRLTKILFKNQNLFQHLMERGYTNNRTLLKMVLSSIEKIDMSDETFFSQREISQKYPKYLNLLGGRIILDTLDQKYLDNVAQDFYQKVINGYIDISSL